MAVASVLMPSLRHCLMAFRPSRGNRDFHIHVFRAHGTDLAGFVHDAGIISLYDLYKEFLFRGENGDDFRQHVFGHAAAFGQNRGVGGDTGNGDQFVEIANTCHIGCVQHEFHNRFLLIYSVCSVSVICAVFRIRFHSSMRLRMPLSLAVWRKSSISAAVYMA